VAPRSISARQDKATLPSQTSVASKSANESANGNSVFQKSLQIKGEVNPEFTFID